MPQPPPQPRSTIGLAFAEQLKGPPLVSVTDHTAAVHLAQLARKTAWLFERPEEHKTISLVSPQLRLIEAQAVAVELLQVPWVFGFAMVIDIGLHLDGADCTTEAIELAAEFYEHLAGELS